MTYAGVLIAVRFPGECSSRSAPIRCWAPVLLMVEAWIKTLVTVRCATLDVQTGTNNENDAPKPLLCSVWAQTLLMYFERSALRQDSIVTAVGRLQSLPKQLFL